MSYTPTTWAAGDTVTAAKLNKLEQGVASGSGVLVVTDTEGTLNKTFKEINDASNSGCLIIVLYNGSYWYQGTPIDTENLYMSFRQLSLNQIGSTYYMPAREYVAESVNDYPVLDV